MTNKRTQATKSGPSIGGLRPLAGGPQPMRGEEGGEGINRQSTLTARCSHGANRRAATSLHRAATNPVAISPAPPLHLQPVRPPLHAAAWYPSRGWPPRARRCRGRPRSPKPSGAPPEPGHRASSEWIRACEVRSVLSAGRAGGAPPRSSSLPRLDPLCAGRRRLPASSTPFRPRSSSMVCTSRSPNLGHGGRPTGRIPPVPGEPRTAVAPHRPFSAASAAGSDLPLHRGGGEGRPEGVGRRQSIPAGDVGVRRLLQWRSVREGDVVVVCEARWPRLRGDVAAIPVSSNRRRHRR